MIGNSRFEAVIRDTISRTLMLAGDPASALAHFVEALAIRREIGDRRYEAESLNHVRLAQLRIADQSAALTSLTGAVDISRDIADPHLEAIALNSLAQADLSVHDLTAAPRSTCRLRWPCGPPSLIPTKRPTCATLWTSCPGLRGPPPVPALAREACPRRRP